MASARTPPGRIPDPIFGRVVRVCSSGHLLPRVRVQRQGRPISIYLGGLVVHATSEAKAGEYAISEN
jgi:hypothetical protein